MNRCPTVEQLRELLADALAGPDAAAVEAHAVGCVACQQALEQLAAGESVPRRGGPGTAPPSPSVRKDDEAFLRRLEAAPPWDSPTGPEPPDARRDEGSSCGAGGCEPDSIFPYTLAPPFPGCASDPPESHPGLRIGGYEILGLIGKGGMGAVYKARHLRLNRLVALKLVLAGKHAQPAALLRFRIESEAVAALAHPNIVQLHEVGEADGCPYLTLEYVEGGTLAHRLKEKPFPPREAADMVRVLALAMDYAHRRGVVHRDLKPANVLLTAEGQPKISDFGLAKRLHGGQGQTETGDVLGTPSYMAPEQAQGRTREIGPATDVYALGAILYNLLTGQPPFEGVTPLETLLQVTSQEPVPPSRLRPGLPRDLETICLKCLAKEPARRYASAEALAEDLRRFLAGEPVQARPVTTLERAVKWIKRRPAAAGLIVVSCLALLALVGGGVGLWYNGKLQAALREVEQQRADAEEFKEQIRYAREMQLAHQAWQDAQMARVVGLLDGWRPTTAEQVDRRGWEWYYLNGLCNKGDRTLVADGEGLCSAAWSPDGRWILAGGVTRSHDFAAPTRVHVWDARRWQKVRTLGGHQGAIEALAFHPDGRLLATGGYDSKVRLWDLDRWEEVGVLTQPQVVGVLAISADGRRLASAGTGPTIHLWDTSTRQPAGTIQAEMGPIAGLAFSLDGRLLVFCCSETSTAWIWDLAEKRLRHTLKGHALGINGLALSRDGRWLATASRDQTVRVWDTTTWQERAVCKGHRGQIFRVGFSPDGRHLASGGRDGTVRLWDAATGKEVRQFRGHPGAVCGVAFSPDGGWLTSGDFEGTVKVWDLTGGQQEARLLAGHEDRVMNVAVSPDGRRLASASSDKTVRLWDLPGGQPRQTLGHDDGVWAMAFSPDGRRLASAGRGPTIQLWDADRGARLRTYQGHTKSVRGLAFSPDGRWLASAGFDQTVKVHDVAGGQILAKLEGHRREVWDVAFSPDGRLLASAGDDAMVRLWDTEHWQPVTTFSGHKGTVYRAVFSPDGQRLASADVKGTILVWDVASRQRQLSLAGHWGEVQGLAFSPDGRRLASGADDQTVRIWDLGSGQELLSLRGHTAPVWSVVFSPDGRWLISGGGEAAKKGPIRLWEAPPAEGPR